MPVCASAWPRRRSARNSALGAAGKLSHQSVLPLPASPETKHTCPWPARPHPGSGPGAATRAPAPRTRVFPQTSSHAQARTGSQGFSHLFTAQRRSPPGKRAQLFTCLAVALASLASALSYSPAWRARSPA